MSTEIEKIASTFRNVARCPSIMKGTLLPNGESRYILESNWQQRDLEREEYVKFVKWATLGVHNSEIEVGARIPSSELRFELLSRYSNCGKLKAVVREVTDKDKKKIQYLEVWDESKKIVNINLKELDRHGEVHSNTQFGSLEWSKDGSRVLYIAEAKVPKTESFFKISHKIKECHSGDEAGNKKEECHPGNEHIYKESWGEQLVECHRPTVCVLDVKSKEVSVFTDIISSDISAGQAIWGRNNEIIFVGWKNAPFRLGLIYCMIRQSDLYLLDLDSKTCKALSHGKHSIFFPRLHPDGNHVYFIENPVGGPHLNCNKLMSLELPAENNGDVPSKCKVVVDVVKSAKPDEFPGLFVLEMAQNCWSSDGRYLFVTSAWRSQKCALVIEVSTGAVKQLTPEGNVSVLDVRDDVIVVSHATPSSPPKIKVGKLQDGSIVGWTVVERPQEDFADIKWSVHQYDPEKKNPDYSGIDCEYILIQPAGGAADPRNRFLVINPHGGPHSHHFVTYTPGTAGLCLLGFTLVQVNYRGSIGFGKDGIHSLPGNIGAQDVGDVQQAARIVKEELGFDKVFVTGGSHGGFLSLHLISQFPDFYLAACARNPVANLASKAGITDIPDWNYCEAGIAEFTHDSIPTAEVYAKLLEKSPMAHITKAKAPCMIMIGDVDLRVPPSQGMDWAKKYKALGKKCKVLEYKGNNHPLSKIDAEADGFVNMVLWFQEHK